jgi:alginate O-acetyltransferase complex protein AlgI
MSLAGVGFRLPECGPALKEKRPMVFCTNPFTLFFILVMVVYWAIKDNQSRVYLLLAASFFFYAYCNWQLAFLIVFSTTVDFYLARGIEDSKDPRRKKQLLLINICGNLGLLCFFKYTNFFLDSISHALMAAGLTESAFRPLKVIIPVGISFYTFEAISYMVDVYNGKVKAERNLAHFQLFILFFPHLVSGPIVRGRDFLPQVGRRKRWSWPRAQVGVQLILMGAFKKLAIADRMAEFANPVFQNPEAFRTSAVWVAVIAWSLQIYGDFSGYTDMALGCAHLLGYKLSLNFNMPYIAQNVSDFWRRWHISLSSWLRDYLFIPLGGSRGSNWKVCRNLMITMVLGGLWHLHAGETARWTYVVWGFLHGSYLIIHRVFKGLCDGRPLAQAVLQSIPGTIFRCALTFLAVAVGWVFFRAETFAQAFEVLRRMIVPSPGGGFDMHTNGVWFTVLAVVVCHAVAASGLWKRWNWRIPAPALGFSYALVLTLTQLLAPQGGTPFIYFQF